MLIQTKRLILSFILATNLILFLFYNYVTSLHNSITEGDSLDEDSYDSITQRAKGIVPRPSFDPNERYLAYLPHSGFHNQRITLENALLLAKYLNRTLLVPPVFLGPATEWRLFDVLHRRILLQTKRGLDHCGRIRKGNPLPGECLNYYSWTTVQWEFFYDMATIRKQQPLKFRADHSFAWMETHLGVDRKKDIYVIDDNAHYDYQIFDDPNSQTERNPRYLRRVNVEELARIEQRVLHMGSLFGTGRVLAELPESKTYQQFLRHTMILSTPILTKTSDAIIKKLGGLGGFVGLHLRVGDGMFVEPAPQNVENMFQRLVDITGITPIPNYQILPSSVPSAAVVTDAGADHKEADTGANGAAAAPVSESNAKGEAENEDEEEEGEDNATPKEKTPMRLSFDKCRALKDSGGKYTIIYIATDGVYPRRNILFRKLFDHFPCIFTLDDFSEHLAELKQMKNTDGVGLAKDLIPMVDAVTSAKGRYFMGTPKSTFSTYVQKQLHPVFVEGLFDADGNRL
ncbi:hypothetical protein BGZ94_007863 [Podila epigama]|nr:hypothetical protein BGZ94_007863 [Podila epigama]